jgi:subtilisin family serine protease
MDPALNELIGAGPPSDEVAVLLRLADGVAPEGARIVARFGDIATARLDRGAIRRVHNTGGVKSVKAPGVYRPDWLPAAEQADSLEIRPSDVRRPANLTQTGRGIVVALIDWGLDFAHPDFRNPDGSSRLLALWDQRKRAAGRSNNRYGYGWVHDRAAIDSALRQPDPYATMAFHPADAGPGPNHGTHTAGIAAGNGRSGGPPGMAPECDLIFVHLATAVGERGDNLGDSVALLEAIDFIARVAGTRPWVLSLSMGRHAGPHDGCTLTEQGMDAALAAAPGRACLQSTGNYFNRPIHTQGVLRPGEVRDIGFHTAEQDGFGHEIDIWYSGRDRITVELIAPSRQSSGSARTGEKTFLLADGKNIGRLYNRQRDPNNHDNQAHVYLDESAPRGAWILRLRGTDVVDGRYHCWVERDPNCSSCQPSFDPGDAVASSTTGTICNGLLTVAVGAYDAHSPDRPLAPFSSAGPTRDGRFKPDILAPGVKVLSARSTPRLPVANQPMQARMSGTSMASPFTAGVVALMFQAAGRLLPVRQTREMLLQTAEAVSGESQSRWGSGYINVTDAVALAAAASSPDARAISLPPLAARSATIGEALDLERQLFAPLVELRDQSDRPYAGPFAITLPTGEILHQHTDAAGTWRRAGLPPGRYTVTVDAHTVDLST